MITVNGQLNIIKDWVHPRIPKQLNILVIWIKKLTPKEKGMAISLSLILGGAIGNLIDRVRFGYVVDFLDVYYGSSHWPAFNIADSAICLGAGLLILDIFLNDTDKEQTNA